MADWSTNGDSIAESMALAAALLRHYGFDMAGQTIGEKITTWVQDYPSSWLRAAVIEALYQGRYKAVSVQQILTIWQRRSRALCHFNSEFERMVCSPVLEGYSLASVAEELAAIADLETLSYTPPASPSPELEHGDQHTQTHDVASASQSGFHSSIPTLRPFAQQPKAKPSGDRLPLGLHRRAIDQFEPQPDSEFCQRLQAMAASNVAEPDHHASDADDDNREVESAFNPSASVDSAHHSTSRLDEWTEATEESTPPDSMPKADPQTLTNTADLWD